MALVVKDRVRETTTTTGTGTVTLGGAVAGFQSFSVIGNANTTYYAIVDNNTGDWEVGIGTYTSAGTSLSRDTVLESSNSGNLVVFSVGTKDVFCTYPAERSVYVDGTSITPGATATLPITSGGTGASTNSTARTNLGASTVGSNFFTLTNPSAITFPRINADNSVSALSASDFRTAIGAGTGSGDVVGPSSATDNAIARFDLTTGKLIQNSVVTIADTTGDIAGAGSITSTSSSGILTRAAATQDGVALVGRAGGTSSWEVTLTPNTLTADRTLTLPDASGTILQSGTAVTVAQGGTGITSGTSGGIPYYSSTSTIASSGVLTASAIMLGGGAGVAPATTTTGTGVVTALGIAVGSSGAFTTNNATNTFTAAQVISVNSASDALRITQIGAGNALVVEDNSNPDSTPFVVDSSGNVIVGYTTTQAFSYSATPKFQVSGTNQGTSAISVFSANASNALPASALFGRARGTLSAPTVVSDGDDIGQLRFEAHDGTALIPAATILAEVDGTPGTNDMPGRLVFSTTADGASSPTERMRINNAGAVGIGTATLTGFLLRGTGNLTGSVSSRAVDWSPAIQSDVTNTAYVFSSVPSVQDAAFTLTSLGHFRATQGTKGASATVTNQYGFFAESSLTGATNNYGFYSNIDSGTGRWNFYAAGTADNYFGGPTTISVSSSSDALRITQTGTGNALVVEDSTNPDSTPFVVDTSGNVVVGFTSTVNTRSGTTAVTPSTQIVGISAGTSGFLQARYSADANGPIQFFSKSRNSSRGQETVVQDGDALGAVSFGGSDGTQVTEAARISVAVDGTPGTNDMPGRLVFSTTADGASTPTERMRIDNAGNVGVGLTPSTKLDVLGSGQFRPAATQDAVVIAGRAGGTSSYAVTLTPTTLSANRTLTLPDATTTVVGTDTTQTLTNKRVTPRVSTTTSSATPTINTDTTDVFGLTAQAVDITSFTTNLSGTPTDGQKLQIYIVGTAARAITWGASFEASTVALPTTTVSTNRLDVGFVWNAATSKWRCLATA